MKTSLWLGLLVAVGLAIAGLPAKAVDGVVDVYELSVSLKGVIQYGDNGSSVVEKVKANGDDIANLALGQEPGSLLPPNVVLAWAASCSSPNPTIIVYDTQAQVSIATVAVTVEGVGADDSKKGVFFLLMDVQSVGGMAYGLEGGILAVSGSYKVGEGDCPLKIGATVSGAMDVTFTDDVGTKTVLLLISKGSVKVGNKIGTLAD